MIWQQYPHRWLVVEGIDGHTQNGEWLIQDLQVIREFGDDSSTAWRYYLALRKLDKDRDYWVLHTDRVELHIEVVDAFGRTSDDEEYAR